MKNLSMEYVFPLYLIYTLRFIIVLLRLEY